MRWNGRALFCGLWLAFGLLAPAAEATPQDEPETAVTDTEEAQKRPGVFSRFALNLEAMFGTSSADEFSSSITTSDAQESRNFIGFEDVDNARLSVGWKLPEDRGLFRLSFTGHRETDYTFRGSGRRVQVASATSPINSFIADDPVQWWTIDIQNGMLVSQAQTPTWSPANDANGNGIPDPGEITYLSTNIGTTRDVTDTLDNKIHTLELLYEREFGGQRRYSGRWGAGLRYFAYEGNTPAAAWLRTSFRAVGQQHGGFQGYTDGAGLRLLSFSQDSTATGPTGFAEFDISFRRQRVVLYWLVRAAFVVQDSEADSGVFFTLVDDASTGALFPAAARVREERDKDVWHSGAEAGLRVRVASGLTFIGAYYLEQYADALLMPTRFSIPETLQQAGQGTVSLFTTRDIRLDGWRAGFAFQF